MVDGDDFDTAVLKVLDSNGTACPGLLLLNGAGSSNTTLRVFSPGFVLAPDAGVADEFPFVLQVSFARM
jgi:hypothetical protein